MRSLSVILAVEDPLSEIVARKILEALRIGISHTLGLQGKGHLKRKAPNLNQTAKGFPVLMLTDQDSPAECPPQLIQSWVQGQQSPMFLLRVAVMEIESWVLADRRGFTDFLRIPLHRIPEDTDAIQHPKEFLVSLARLSKKTRLRQALVPARGATSTVGPEYNSYLWEFVHTHWSIDQASSASMSLKRTLERLRSFVTSH